LPAFGNTGFEKIMMKFIAAYLTTAVVMIVIDLVWLGLIAKPLYQQGIGQLMTDQPNIAAAVAFYLLFPVGVMVFAITPQAAMEGWQKSAMLGALFGFFTYATYDLTNLATLKNYPVSLALIDMFWGTLVSATAACAGKLVFNRFLTA
jgi:uncharacterized membrane protein